MVNRHLLVLVAYTLLTSLLTWPLTAQLTSHIPGEATWAFDESTFIWNMWWFKHSLLNLGQTPLQTDYIFYPLGVNLTTYTFNLFNAAFGLPLQLALSLPLANNLSLIFSYVSSGYGMFLLTLYLLNRLPLSQPAGKRLYLAAFAAGAVFAFSASRMMYIALGHYNFVTIQWFPFFTLFIIRAFHHGRVANMVLTAIFAALCLYAELTYSVFLIFLTLLLAWGTAGHRTESGQLPAWLVYPVRLAMITGLTFGLTAPFVLSVLPDFLDPAYAEPGWGEGLKLSADLVGLVTLTPLHPLAGVDWVNELRAVIEGQSRFSDANTLFLGYAILVMAGLGLVVQWSRGRMWLIGLLGFTLLSLGPLLTINGQNRFNLDGLEVTVPLPFAILHYLPLINANRVPNRFGILVTLCLAVLVGYGLFWLLNRWRASGMQWATFIIVGALLLADQYSVPLPMTEARMPTVYEQIGAEPAEFTVMQLPLGWRNSYGTLGAERTQLQYYQAAHQRPMLGGNTSRNPAFKFDYYRQIPLFFALTETELYREVDETTLSRARQQAAELMTLYNIKYLVIHEPIPHRKPYEDTYQATQALALDLIPHDASPVYQSPGVQAWAVQQADLPDPLRLDFGDWTSDPYRGVGWAGNETIFEATANWITGQQAEIFLPVRGSGSRQLQLQIAPFDYPTAPAQTVQLTINDSPTVIEQTLQPGWQILDVTLPATSLQSGLNRLTLEFNHTAQPRQVLPAQITIGSTGVSVPVDIEVNSGADFAFISLGLAEETIDASTHRQGVNLAVVDSQTGDLVAKRGFDTAANEFEVAALNQFIDQIPTGQIVIVATKGLAVNQFFNQETIDQFRSLGITPETIQQPPFSAIGLKDSSQSAAQTFGDGYLRLGRNPDTRPLAAAVDWLIISRP